MTDLDVRWTVFRTALLRSAGFPFDWLNDLASRALEDRSTVLVDAHARRETARDEVLRTLWAMRGSAERAEMTALNRAIRVIGKGRTVTESHPAVSAATVQWNTAVAEYDSLFQSTELDALLTAEHERTSRLLLEQVTADYFKDAVLLSTPSMYEACCRTSDPQTFLGSQLELAAYRFLQRFCAKNETGGAIGPVNLLSVGPARPAPGTDPATIMHFDDPVLGRIEYSAEGDGRSAERRTFMSYWAACELGRSLVRSANSPHDARQPFRMFGVPAPELSAVDARVLARVDGRRSIEALAVELDEPIETVDASITRLAGLGLVEEQWRPPYFTRDAGEDVRQLAQRIDTPHTQDVDRLIADIRGFAQAKLADRPAMLSAITEDFSRLTDKPAWRGAGRLKGDRAVFYEDARANIRNARIGSTGTRQLTERLSTVLDLLASLAIEERAAGQSLLAAELTRRNVRELPAVDVRDMPIGVAAPSPDGTTMRERFLRLIDPSLPWVELSREDLVNAGLIRADLNDWPIFGAADLMLTGPDNGQATGPGSIILSELHHIWPPLASWVRALHDDGDLGNGELWQTVARELAPAVPTMQEIVRKGKNTDSTPFGHTVLCLDTGLSIPGAVMVPAEQVVVRPWENGFIGLHDPASQRDLWLVPDYDDNGVSAGGLINCATPALSLTAFKLGPHTPRIVIDGVIVQRRRWEISAADIPTASGRAPSQREWLALQVWRRDLGLPKHLYFWLDTEVKPMYLDFSSVLSVANFHRCLRPAQRVVLAEAQPDPDRLWLRTKDGTLTSEMRTLLWRDRRQASTVLVGGS
jgi:hypothetical protein